VIQQDVRLTKCRGDRPDDFQERDTVTDKDLYHIRALGNFAWRGKKIRLWSRRAIPDHYGKTGAAQIGRDTTSDNPKTNNPDGGFFGCNHRDISAGFGLTWPE
jgi:hypothetical protein